MTKFKNILLVIVPTLYEDYDIIAIGNRLELKQLVKQNKYFHYISSKKYNIPIVILDTCSTLKDAKYVYKEFKKEFIELDNHIAKVINCEQNRKNTKRTK